MRKIIRLSRRKLFAILFSGLAYSQQSFAKIKKNIGDIIHDGNLQGQTTAILFDLKTNKILESYNKDLKLPLASVTKAVTAVYGIETVGEEYSFSTKLFFDGKIRQGMLEGDLYLVGGSDPSLSTNDLYKFVEAFNKKGIKRISGDFFYYSEMIPEFLTIDPSQQSQESYNPGFSGLNLDNNRVLFSWRKEETGYDLRLETSSGRTKVSASSISIVEKNYGKTVFGYTLQKKQRLEKWSVLKRILGKKGARWLPVRLSSTFTASVLHQLLEKNNILVPKPKRLRKKVFGMKLLSSHRSEGLSSIIKRMLDRSTNVTAEIIGVFAANYWGFTTPKISSSGLIMTKWFNFVSKTNDNLFFNHSGLTADSRVSSLDFSKFLTRQETKNILVPLLKEKKIYGHEKKKIVQADVQVLAKTGTMHFNRGLGGYIMVAGVPCAAFAIFSANIDKKQSIKKHQLSNPPGSKAWLTRAKNLENSILVNWALKYI